MPRIVSIVLLVLVAAAAGFVAGRGTSIRPPAAPAAPLPPANDTVTVIGAVDAPGRPPGLLLDSVSADLTGDGMAERVELYADVERDARSRLMWDDGQRWMLIVVRQGRIHPLIDRFVQLGRVRFWALEHAVGGKSLLVLVETGSGMIAESYAFDSVTDGFRRVEQLQLSGNVVHITPPDAF